MRKFPNPVRVALLASALTAATCAQADNLDELRTLVSENNAPAAWDMAQRLAPQSSGDPEFDFWYGIAARGAGKKNEALFAFERVVVAQPDNSRAKLELADVYYQFGNMAEARVLFNDVLAGNPPEPVQQKVRTYLGAIDAAEQSKQSTIRYVLGFAAGHDSNIGSSTDDPTHAEIAPITLTNASLATDAAFIDARAGLEYVSPVSQRTIRFLTATLQRRDNEDIFAGGNFDNTQLSVSGGWMLRRGTATWRIPVGVQALWSESVRTGALPVNDDRLLTSVGAEYSKPLSAQTSMAWFGRVGDSHYASEPDRNTWLLSVGGSHGWSAPDAPVTITTALTITLEPAQEDTPGAGRNEKDHVATLRGNLRWEVAPGQSLVFGLGVQSTQYKLPSLGSAPADRLDTLVDTMFGWQWVVQKDWTLNADVSLMQNDSQGTLYDFDRTQFRLGSTWRF